MEDKQENKTEKAEPSPAHKKDETITIKKETLWKYSTFVLGAIVIIGALAMITGDGRGTPPAAVVADQPAAPTAPAPSPSIEVDPSKLQHVRGPQDAEVIVVEWTDFECPFCKRHYQQTSAQLEQAYEGKKVAFAKEHFPLSFHPNAQKAAEATECAAKVGGEDAFWEMHDLMFDRGVQGGVSSFKAYAGELGLDQADFDDCLDSGEMASVVNADMQEGSKAGVTGTPGFAIYKVSDKSATKLAGAQPFPAFQAAIDGALASLA